MRKEVFKVDEKDYKLIQRLKAIRTEDKQYNRLRSISLNELKIKGLEREEEFKRKQLKEGKCVEKHEGFIDGVRPLFMLNTDIERIEYDIKNLKEVIKATKEEYDKEKK